MTHHSQSILLPSSRLSFACTVRLPAVFYHLNQPQPSSSPEDSTALGGSSLLSNLATSTPTKTVRANQDGDIVFQGHLLEVRWLRECDEEKEEEAGSSPLLLGFVRWSNVDHRQSGWYPLSCISLRPPSAVQQSLSTGEEPLLKDEEDVESCVTTAAQTAAQYIKQPLLSTVYREVTPGMARTARSTKTIEYLEERLLRDGITPTVIRYYLYLNTFAFNPWYFSPYGILLSEYDPLLRLPSPAPAPATEEREREGPGEVNPYIRDGYLCPFSLRVFSSAAQLRHETRQYRAGRLRPPGVEIYRDEKRGLSVFEVNGSKYKTYSRFLFLLGKSFLENKLVGHDVHNYLFYVVCFHHRHFPDYIDDPSAMYFAGYFSWERGVKDYNLACIVTLPCFTGNTGGSTPRQLGQFMIALSYELGYRRQQVGTPERPLSDLGEVTYRRYWQRVLLPWLQLKAMELEDHHTPRKRQRAAEEEEEPSTRGVPATIREMAQFAKLEEADVLKTVVGMGLLHRSSENRNLSLVLPKGYVERELNAQQEREGDCSLAVFDIRLLNTERSSSKGKTPPASKRKTK